MDWLRKMFESGGVRIGTLIETPSMYSSPPGPFLVFNRRHPSGRVVALHPHTGGFFVDRLNRQGEVVGQSYFPPENDQWRIYSPAR